MQVIINADDLGYSREVNEATFALMEARKISSATILVSGACFEDAVRRAKRFPGCSFGVHLNLTELAALTSPAAFRESGLTNAEGIFVGSARSVRPTEALKEAVYHEWCRQIDRLLDSGIQCSHLDSHHHVHTIPWLLGTFRRVVRKYRICKVRKSMNWYYAPEVRPSRSLLAKKALYNAALRHWCGAKTTGHFTRFSWFVQNMRHGEIRRSGVAELMVHPGSPEANAETDLLWSSWQATMPCEIELISYNDL